MDTPETTFGKWLTAMMKERRITPNELVTKTGITRGYIGILMNDTPHSTTGKPPQPKPAKLLKIANALGVPEEMVLVAAKYLHPDAALDSYTVKRVISIITKFPTERQVEVLDFVEMLERRLSSSPQGSTKQIPTVQTSDPEYKKPLGVAKKPQRKPKGNHGHTKEKRQRKA